MSTTVAAAVVAGAAGLLGATLGWGFQYWQVRKEHKWALEDVKREAYVEFLRSISASYAQAKSEAMSRQSHESGTKSPQTEKPQGPSQESHKKEEADLRAATARIVLLAKQDIYKEAIAITERAIIVHNKLRSGDPDVEDDDIEDDDIEDDNIEDADVKTVNSRREALIGQFKDDLGIPSDDHKSRIKLLIRLMRPAKSTSAAER